ncbi:SusD-like starch-binding protein associating with outer membrane [Mucilaginibacter yixingensis]|uniref:SusD-like starch-binding protein associating with outer membrane n=1 Tax=Mucilaginibacter yixingensis TaxID=1295612 RepID=A0A2T5J8Z1_9SPHI|nr:SusD/RagB family nutrient-binding outer membrane lipoprotein [Mucilaginibacter yixingensis]PTQ96542.1 SusD-like starch-binding protein associating with outer membrane [Mucilaginibacter yixingensis]
MNTISKYISGLLILSAATFSSCKKEFQTLNTNPNQLEKANDPSLLGNIEVTSFFNSAYNAWTLGNGMSQYATFSQSYYNTLARYIPSSNQPYWQVLYTNARDANQIIADSKANGNTSMQALGLIMRSYSFAQLTDLWGDIPFKNALQGQNGNFTASYDSQQTVYTDSGMGVLPSLRAADSLLKSSVTAITGDLVYGGDVTKWRKFCNGLRLRYLLRASGKLSTAAAEMQSIVSSGMIFQSASESAELALPTSVPYAFPSVTERSGDYSIKYLNTLMYNFYVNTGDQARLSMLFSKNVNNQSASGFNFSYYGGMPVVADANTTQVNSGSGFNSAIFVSSPSSIVLKARLLTYAEVQFILAEASLKNLISTGTAATYYTNGVAGAYADYGIDATTTAAYLTNPNVVFNPVNGLNQILTQKWAANLNVGFEGWLEYRRTGIPALDATSANLNNNKISSRFIYPPDEQTINAVNYKSELQKMGGTDNPNYKAWW